MQDVIVYTLIAAWAISGAIGGQMLNYPGDGATFRNLMGPFIGPFALLIAILERTRSRSTP